MIWESGYPLIFDFRDLWPVGVLEEMVGLKQIEQGGQKAS